MTRFITFAAAAFLSLAIGCDNNSLTDAPVGTSQAAPAEFARAATLLEIEGIIWEPGYNNINAVEGQIYYVITYDNDSHTSSAVMHSRGTVHPYGQWGPVWTFEAGSTVTVPTGSSFELRFQLEGRSDGIRLVLVLTAGEEELVLEGMRSEVPLANGE